MPNIIDLLAGADDFFARFAQSRCVYLSGRVGTGKTLFSVWLSAELHRRGFVDATVSTFPLAWGVPAAGAPMLRVCYILDELGAFFDSRSAMDKRSNEFRKTVLAFPRKIESYIVVSSRVVVDKSFRGLTAQRYYPLPGGWSIWAYSEDEGVAQNDGIMLVPNLSGYWPYYHHKHVPGENNLEWIADHILEAIDTVRTFDFKDPNYAEKYNFPKPEARRRRSPATVPSSLEPVPEGAAVRSALPGSGRFYRRTKDLDLPGPTDSHVAIEGETVVSSLTGGRLRSGLAARRGDFD